MDSIYTLYTNRNKHKHKQGSSIQAIQEWSLPREETKKISNNESLGKIASEQ